MNNPCITCRYFSQYWLGEAFTIDNLCAHPQLMFYYKNPTGLPIAHKVLCKVMRTAKYRCGEYGKLWEPSVS